MISSDLTGSPVYGFGVMSEWYTCEEITRKKQSGRRELAHSYRCF